jgi:hypothetical protein
MYNAAFDSKSHQAIRHLGTESSYYPNPKNAGSWREIRLSGLKTELATHNFDISFIDLEPKLLDYIDVLVISGRSNRILFTEEELRTVKLLCSRGVGLFLMANHSGFIEPQNQIAQCLFPHIVFHEKPIPEARQQHYLNHSHPISHNCQQGISVRTSCTMSVTDNSDTKVLISNEDSDIGVFSVAIENVMDVPKRSVVIASAGHIASLDDSHRDMFNEASNKVWTLNAIRWLAGILE